MADAQVLYAESVAATTANSTTWVDLASIAAASFTAGAKYLILANQVTIHDNLSNHTRVRLVHGTTPTVFDDASCSWEGQGGGVSTQSHEISYLFVYTQPNPTTELVKLQISVNTTGSTVTNRLSQIMAINLDDIGTDGADYFFSEDLVNYTITTTPTAKATTASFTPNGTDRWLYIGNMVEDIVTIVDEIGFELYDSVAGVLGLCWQEAEDTADVRAHTLFWAGVPTNAARTLSIRPVEEGGSNVMFAGRTIAINLSKFAQSASAFDATEVDPANSGGWTTVATIAPNPTNTGDWVVIAFSTVDSDYQNESLNSRLQINASGGGLADDPAYPNAAPGDDAWDPLDENPFNVMNLVSLTSGAGRTINYDWGQVGTTTTIRVEDNGLVAFSVALAAAGTQYNQSVSGGMTPSGALIRDGRKVLAGGITPTGANTKHTSKTFSGDITSIVGELAKQTNKTFEGALSSIVGALNAIKLVFKDVSGGVTPSGALVNQAQRTLTGANTPAGDLTKQTNKTLAGDLSSIVGTLTKLTSKTFTGALSDISGALNAIKIALLSISGGITPSGELSRQANKTLSGDATPTGALTRLTQKVLVGALTPDGALSRLVSVFKSGGITPTGAQTRLTSKGLSGIISSIVGALTSVFQSGSVATPGAFDVVYTPAKFRTFKPDEFDTHTPAKFKTYEPDEFETRTPGKFKTYKA